MEEKLRPTNLLERSAVYRFLNYMVLLGFIIDSIVIAIQDINLFAQNHPGQTPRLFIIDGHFIYPYGAETPVVVLSFILTIIAFIGYLITTRKLFYIRKSKESQTIISLVFYSAFYFCIARLFEAFFIVSESDYKGFIYAFGQFYYLFDIMAICLFIIFVTQVFLYDYFKLHPMLPKFIFLLSWLMAFAFIIVQIFYHQHWAVSDYLIYIIAGFVLLYIFFILFISAQKILKIRKMVSERQQELLTIALLLIGLFIMGILILLVMIAPNLWFGYSFRSVKSALNIVIIIFFWKAFVVPNKQKVESQ
jgi:hypothetical protein